MSDRVLPSPCRRYAFDRARTFAPNAGRRYANSQNFDFGPDDRHNVSTLSPYLRHRVLLETELLSMVLQHHPNSSADKFVEEVFWRIYFKGYLESRPSIWTDYWDGIARMAERLQTNSEIRGRYQSAVSGKTGIDCFDAWVSELLATGYLHNHARMRFASIWIFTLELPWQLGADLFYRNLLDGDPASNTLGWRWVAGLHTRGKTYLARAANIHKYTDGRFRPEGQLATRADPLVESASHPVRVLPIVQALAPKQAYGLLITEEDCYPESLFGNSRPSAIAAKTTSDGSVPGLSPNVASFRHRILNDALERAERAFGVSATLLEPRDWSEALLTWAHQEQLKTIFTPYVPVGPTADHLNEARAALGKSGVTLAQA